MHKHKNNQKNIIEMLESDDELPTEYIEVADVPAYKLDDRFEPLKFKWIDNNFRKYYCMKKEEAGLHLFLNEDTIINKTENLRPGESSLVLNGVLTKKDIYCLKCIETSTSDSTLLWLINFLIYKDIQSNFSFLKTCLVDRNPRISPDKNYLESSEYYKEAKIYNFEFNYKENKNNVNVF